MLGRRAYENQIWIEFEIRPVRGQDVIFVHFEKLERKSLWVALPLRERNKAVEPPR